MTYSPTHHYACSEKPHKQLFYTELAKLYGVVTYAFI